jgi:hypothetical protein
VRSPSSESLLAPVLVEFVEDELVEGELVVVEGEVVVVEGEVVVCEPDPDPPPAPEPDPAAKARAAVPSTKVPASVIVRRCFIVIHNLHDAPHAIGARRRGTPNARLRDWFSGVLAVDLPMKCNPTQLGLPEHPPRVSRYSCQVLTKTGADQ